MMNSFLNLGSGPRRPMNPDEDYVQENAPSFLDMAQQNQQQGGGMLRKKLLGGLAQNAGGGGFLGGLGGVAKFLL